MREEFGDEYRDEFQPIIEKYGLASDPQDLIGNVSVELAEGVIGIDVGASYPDHKFEIWKLLEDEQVDIPADPTVADRIEVLHENSMRRDH